MEDELLKNIPQDRTYCISGGEAYLEVPSYALKGGRNTHFVASFAKRIYKDPKLRDINILSFATDGTDGDTDCAGAYINYELYISLNVDKYLKNFDTFHYFEKLGTLIKTGPTKSNVMDLRIIWREK
jgi:glycerate-2-kinase